MTAVEKLRIRITQMVDEGLKDIHVTWPEGCDLTQEEKAQAVLDMLDAPEVEIDPEALL